MENRLTVLPLNILLIIHQLSVQKIFTALKEAIKGTEEDYTKGSIRRAIFMLSIPMILEMVMEALFSIVDIYFVGKIDGNATDAIAVVGITESVITLVYAVAIGLSMAATALVSRRIGEKNPDAAAVAAAQSIIFATAVSILLGVAGYYYAENILRLMGGSDELIASGLGYTQILFASNIVIMLLFLFNGIFRGAGDAHLAMRALWLANGLNIILDPIFIFGFGPIPAMGVEGAAIATVIGRGIGVIFQFYILFRGSSVIRLVAKHFKTNLEIINRLIKIGAGGAGQFIIASMSWVVLMWILSTEFGSSTVAGFTISMRVVMFTILPSWGMSNAAATLVGQNLGAKQPERAEISVWKTATYNVLFLLIISIPIFIFTTPIMKLFTNDAATIQAGVICLRIMCVGYIAYGYGMVIGQAFNGAGDTRTPTIINFICFWLIEIPLAYWLAVTLDFGDSGVYWAIAIAETVLAILCIIVFKQGKWKAVEI